MPPKAHMSFAGRSGSPREQSPTTRASESLPANPLCRTELLHWLNGLLKLSLTKVEQCSNGAVYCQIMHVCHPESVAVQKVSWKAKCEFDSIPNYRVLQVALDRNRIKKHIEAEKLIRANYQHNLAFLQWLRCYWERAGQPTLSENYVRKVREGRPLPTWASFGQDKPASTRGRSPGKPIAPSPEQIMKTVDKIIGSATSGTGSITVTSPLNLFPQTCSPGLAAFDPVAQSGSCWERTGSRSGSNILPLASVPRSPSEQPLSARERRGSLQLVEHSCARKESADCSEDLRPHRRASFASARSTSPASMKSPPESENDSEDVSEHAVKASTAHLKRRVSTTSEVSTALASDADEEDVVSTIQQSRRSSMVSHVDDEWARGFAAGMHGQLSVLVKEHTSAALRQQKMLNERTEQTLKLHVSNAFKDAASAERRPEETAMMQTEQAMTQFVADLEQRQTAQLSQVVERTTQLSNSQEACRQELADIRRLLESVFSFKLVEKDAAPDLISKDGQQPDVSAQQKEADGARGCFTAAVDRDATLGASESEARTAPTQFFQMTDSDCGSDVGDRSEDLDRMFSCPCDVAVSGKADGDQLNGVLQASWWDKPHSPDNLHFALPPDFHSEQGSAASQSSSSHRRHAVGKHSKRRALAGGCKKQGAFLRGIGSSSSSSSSISGGLISDTEAFEIDSATSLDDAASADDILAWLQVQPPAVVSLQGKERLMDAVRETQMRADAFSLYLQELPVTICDADSASTLREAWTRFSLR